MKRVIGSVILILWVTVASAQRTVQTKFGDTLSKNWMAVRITLTDSVFVQIEGPAKSWFALGLNTKHMQSGVDVIMVPAWKEAFMSLTPYDAVLTGYAPPKRDKLEHWVIKSEEMKNGRRSFELVRAIATGDEEDFDFTELTKNGGPLNVIWAMGSEKEDKTEYHGNLKGKRVIIF
ncbi:MAG: DOMON domain-containing protein [Flavobacteriales bacterium]